MEKNKQPDDDEDNENLDENMNRANNGNDRDETDENLRNSALVLVEEISMDESTDSVEVIEGLLKMIRGA
jgi:hypothetical protein